MMVRLGIVHPLDVFPGEVSYERKNGHGECLEPEHGRGEESWYQAIILGGYSNHGSDGGIDGNEDVPNHHTARNSDDVVLRPVVCHQRGFTEDGQ